MSNGRFELPRPHTVALVAMGASSSDYSNQCAQNGGRHVVADETWTINASGATFLHDRLFAMDDLTELIHDSRLGKKVAKSMIGWLAEHPGPVYVVKKYPQIPGAVEYPLVPVLNHVGFPYLNTSVAYAVAYAMYIGVKVLKLFGCDFTYANHHQGESGRGCVEWLLGIAGERGMKIEVSQTTTLLDANVPMEKRLYGFTEAAVPEQYCRKCGKGLEACRCGAPEVLWRIRFPEREEEAQQTQQLTPDIAPAFGGLNKPPKVVGAP